MSLKSKLLGLTLSGNGPCVLKNGRSGREVFVARNNLPKIGDKINIVNYTSWDFDSVLFHELTDSYRVKDVSIQRRVFEEEILPAYLFFNENYNFVDIEIPKATRNFGVDAMESPNEFIVKSSPTDVPKVGETISLEFNYERERNNRYWGEYVQSKNGRDVLVEHVPELALEGLEHCRKPKRDYFEKQIVEVKNVVVDEDYSPSDEIRFLAEISGSNVDVHLIDQEHFPGMSFADESIREFNRRTMPFRKYVRFGGQRDIPTIAEMDWRRNVAHATPITPLFQHDNA